MDTHENLTTTAIRSKLTPNKDVLLIGSGLAVDLLAAILARAGRAVTVRPAPGKRWVNPGVTTVPYTAELLYLLSARYRVPEIADLAMYADLPERVAATSGIKANLGFIYHRPRRSANPEENLQFSVPGEHSEWHAYLPDIQRYSQSVARGYGARYLPSNDGRRESARWGVVLVCAAEGQPSSGRIKAQAHFEDLEPFEDLRPAKDDGYTQPWSGGSAVHAFPGGWLQIAPFDNHPKAKGSGALVSLSIAAAPDQGVQPEDLDAIVAGLGRQYPDLGLQLRRARRTGDWYRPERSPVAVPGALELHVDADCGEVLFGQDFTLALELVHASAAVLLAPGALEAPEQALRSIAQFQAQLLASHARFAAAARTATTGFPSWNAFMRLWLLWSISSALALKKVRLDAVRSGDWSAASKFDAGIGWFDLAPGIAGVLNKSLDVVETMQKGAVLPSTAGAKVLALMSQRRIIPPLFKFGDPLARRYRLNLLTRLKLMSWMFTIAPREYRGMFTVDNITAEPAENVST